MSYIWIAGVGMVSMSVGMFFLNMAATRISPRIVMLVSHALILTLIYCWIKISGDKVLPALKKGAPIGYTLAAGFLFAIGLLALMEALGRGPATTVVPIWGSYIVGASILAAVILKDPMNLVKGIGIGLTFLGIVLISLRG